MKGIIFQRVFKCLSVMAFGFSLLQGYILDPVTEKDRLVDEYFFNSIEEAMNINYAEALEYTDKIIDLVPDHPAGYLYSAAILNWIIGDFYRFDYAQEFLNKIDKAIDLSKDMIQENRLDAWGYVYLGGAYGFRGIYYSKIGSFYYAFIDGVRGNYELNKAISLNPGIYDNYFGTGTFDFWKAYYSGKFFWLGSSEKSKQSGIDKINLAIEKGKYTTLEADYSLIRIYLVDGRFQDAIDKAQKLIVRSPRSIKARFFMGLSYQEQGSYQQALDTFLELREIIGNHSLKTPAILLEINMNIVKAYRDLGLNTQALSLIKSSKKYYTQVQDDNDFLKALLEKYEILSEEMQNKSVVDY